MKILKLIPLRLKKAIDWRIEKIIDLRLAPHRLETLIASGLADLGLERQVLEQVDLVKSKLEISAAEWHAFQAARANFKDVENPLVSVCISTHNRAGLLKTRSLPSVLAQTYANIEVVVVADRCTDETESVVSAFQDPRIRYYKLDRDVTPLPDAQRRWMVSGSVANNFAQSKVRGDYVTHLDDDDEHTPDRIEKLLALAQKEQADFVYHPFYYEDDAGRWLVNQAERPERGSVTTSSIFYRNWMANVLWDEDTHLLMEPADWNRIRKFLYLGATSVRHPEALLRHYKERNQPTTRFSVGGGGGADSGSSARGITLTHTVEWGLRNEWTAVMEAIGEAYGGGDVALIAGIDWSLAQQRPFPPEWIGFFHQSYHSIPPVPGLLDLRAELIQRGALNGCKGIFVLTQFQKTALDALHLGVPIERLWHPTPLDVPRWRFEAWEKKRDVAFAGRWLRRPQVIQDLRYSGGEKLWLAKEAGPIKDIVENGTVRRLPFIANDAYDKLLADTVIMSEVIDAAANNLVLECIARATPILINWNTGAVEYLGAEYPLFYGSLAEAEWKLSNPHVILDAHQYLLRMDKTRFSIETFCRDFGASSIYRSLTSGA